MDRKGIIAVTLSLIVLIAWQFHFGQSYKQPAPAQTSTSSPTPTPTQQSSATPVIAENKTAPVVTEELTTPEVREKLFTQSAEYFFTNLGGGISEVVLLKHSAENGEKVVLNKLGQIPIGAISDSPGEGIHTPYKVNPNSSSNEVICERITPQQIQIIKKFTLPKSTEGKDEYLIQLELIFTNQGQQLYQSNGYFVYGGSSVQIHKDDLPTYTMFGWYHKGKFEHTDVNWFSEGSIPLIGYQTHPERPNYTQSSDKILWAGVMNQYFTTIIGSIENHGQAVWAKRFPVDSEPESPFGIQGALGATGFKLNPGEVFQQKFTIYAGPKEYQRLKQFGNGEEEMMHFGIFKWVSILLLTSMNWLNSVLGNYATAIVVLTIFIKSAMWPLQNKATNSMKRMQLLQPRQIELREKFKDDPTRMNQEMMKLYKEYGVNPFGGCLPMLIQIPIFFGFYSMLGTAIELRNSQFLWVQDLSQPDTVFHLGIVPVNILPLLMAATMFWQMAISPKSGDAIQQRVFMFVPLIFIFFCYNFASALALYWTVQNVFSIVQLYATRNQALPTLQKAPAAQKKKKRRGNE